MTGIFNCVVIHKTKRHCGSRKELTVQQTGQLHKDLWHAGRTTPQSPICACFMVETSSLWYQSQYKTHVSILQFLYTRIDVRSWYSTTLNNRAVLGISWPIRERNNGVYWTCLSKPTTSVKSFSPSCSWASESLSCHTRASFILVCATVIFTVYLINLDVKLLLQPESPSIRGLGS